MTSNGFENRREFEEALRSAHVQGLISAFEVSASLEKYDSEMKAAEIAVNLSALEGLGPGDRIELNDERGTILDCEAWETERGSSSFQIRTRGGDVTKWGCFTNSILRCLVKGGATVERAPYKSEERDR